MECKAISSWLAREMFLVIFHPLPFTRFSRISNNKTISRTSRLTVKGTLSLWHTSIEGCLKLVFTLNIHEVIYGETAILLDFNLFDSPPPNDWLRIMKSKYSFEYIKREMKGNLLPIFPSIANPKTIPCSTCHPFFDLQIPWHNFKAIKSFVEKVRLSGKFQSAFVSNIWLRAAHETWTQLFSWTANYQIS
jgi:hypothetical protein